MAPKPVFTILCFLAIVIGFLTFIFGLGDRIGIQMQISFLMLPVWNGFLFGWAGFAGLMIGRQNKRQGYVGSASASGLKAIHMLCFGLSLLSFYMYGSVVMYSGFRIEYNDDYSWNYPTRPALIPKQPNTFDGTPDDDTRQGIFAVIIIFSLVEMFLGAWIIMLEKEKMVFGSPSSADQVPLITSQANAQYVQPNAAMAFAPPQVQQQQQPVYMVASGSNAPLPARAVVAPTSQQQQQPTYVVLQPSATMATNEPQMIQQPQPRYVVLQNQVPNAPPAQFVNQGDPTNIPTLPVPVQREPHERTESPGLQTGDVHSHDGFQQSGVKE